MELSQNMLALPGQGKTAATASVAARAISTSSDNIDASTGQTSTGVIPTERKNMDEFGNLLNNILEISSASENTGNKAVDIIDLLNPSGNQTANIITSNVLTNIPVPVIMPENAVQNNGTVQQSSLLLPANQGAPSDAVKKSDGANQGIIAATKPGINNPDTNIEASIEVSSQTIPVVNKVRDGNADNKIISTSVMTQSTSVDASIGNLQNSLEDNNSQAPAIATNDAVNVTEKSLSDKSIGDKSIGDKSIGDKSIGDKSIGDKSIGDKSIGDKSIGSAANISSPAFENISADVAPAKRDNLPSDIPIATSQSAETLQNSVKNFIEPQQAVINQASVATQDKPETSTPGQKSAPKKKVEILAGTTDAGASQQPLDQKNPVEHTAKIPAEIIVGAQPQTDNQRLNLTPTASHENTAPQYAANPAATEVASQILPAGQLAAPLDAKSVVNSNISAETPQPRHQDKASLQPVLNANAEQGALPAAQTQNLTSQPQQPPAVNGQGFAQTLTQNSEGILPPAPDGLQQSAGAQSAPGETGNIVLVDKPDSMRTATTPVVSRTETHAPHVSPPIRDIAIHISQNIDTGTNRFQLRLDPPELGRVDVRMEISAEGKLSAVIAVERPETLDLLQRDSRALERSLMEAGLKTDSNSLSFSLKGGRQDNQQTDLSNNKTDSNANPLSDDLDNHVASLTARFSNRAVNIRI